MSERYQLDIQGLRESLHTTTGRKYWRTLDEIAATQQFEEFVHREFPTHGSEWKDPVTRRNFIKLMGASLALAGMTACGHPDTGTIVPYSTTPAGLIPGKPLFFATAMPMNGSSIGLLVESHDGRPTKIEGNPDHPASKGATDAFAQAAILNMYDPDRSSAISYYGDIRPWASLLAEASTQLGGVRGQQGTGFYLLTETVISPTLAHEIQSLLKDYPQAKWLQYEPASRQTARAGAMLAFGRDVNVVYRFDRANVVLALDSDFMSACAGGVRYARDFATRRRISSTNPDMNRLYAVESSPSCTGSAADRRMPMKSSAIGPFAGAVAAMLGVGTAPALTGEEAHLADAIAADLRKNHGASIVIAGEGQPAEVHALVHAMNQALGNFDATMYFTEPVEAASSDQLADIRNLASDLDAGKVEMLVILGGNPVYNAPSDVDLVNRILKARWRLHISPFRDETSYLCQWHVPEAHFLESWGDARTFDGTASVIQPLIAPLYNGKTQLEVLAAFSKQPERNSYDMVRDYWKTQHAVDFETFWKQSLNDGVIAGTAFAPVSVSAIATAASTSAVAAPSHDDSMLEAIFRTDPGVFDGRFANNGWLQEMPKPLTKLTWDNAAMISPATAKKLNLTYSIAYTGGEHGQIIVDVVELEYYGRKIQAPVWILPGHADDSVTLPLGYGRTSAGQVGNGVGFDACWLRRSAAMWFDPGGISVHKTGKTQSLACTQFHANMQGREPVRAATLDEFRKTPNFAQADEPPKGLTLYPGFKYDAYAWGMSVDLNACNGCSACVVACQAENNIPVVGKEQVEAGREMHWIRIDRYYEGAPSSPEAFFQPVMCQQCENAPCEEVCPVGATVHSTEGLNDMVYNRCVGTRYCSNNCPYKVRRFNFLQYADWETPSLKLQRNPEVTVRSRGVMEKCTYCVQRITYARITSEKENREVRDGEIVTACQAACPTQAIIFGNINDPQSQVAKRKAEPRNYGLLADLNTRPRTTYLASVRNPNPELSEDS
jgi:MoCo/4Fe-4S cofactor protein with predicted Tat translocation signal